MESTNDIPAFIYVDNWVRKKLKSFSFIGAVVNWVSPNLLNSFDSSIDNTSYPWFNKNEWTSTLERASKLDFVILPSLSLTVYLYLIFLEFCM